MIFRQTPSLSGIHLYYWKSVYCLSETNCSINIWRLEFKSKFNEDALKISQCKPDIIKHLLHAWQLFSPSVLINLFLIWLSSYFLIFLGSKVNKSLIEEIMLQLSPEEWVQFHQVQEKRKSICIGSRDIRLSLRTPAIPTNLVHSNERVIPGQRSANPRLQARFACL